MNTLIIMNNEFMSNNDTTYDMKRVEPELTYDTLLKEAEEKAKMQYINDQFVSSEGNDYLEHDENETKMPGGIDLNINNYTTSELFDLVGLDIDTATIGMVFETISQIKQQFKEYKINHLVNFFDDVEKILIYELENVILPKREEIKTEENDKEENDKEENNLDDIQNGNTDSIDDLTDEEKTYGDQGETLLSFNSQNNDGVNPLLRENTTRLLCIDSFFRHNSLPSLQNITYSSINNDFKSTYSTTKFSVTLSEPVTYVTKLMLESVHIPNTFYNIDSAYGNNVFAFRFLDVVGDNPLKIINLISGNYDIDLLINDIIDEINSIFTPSPLITNANIFKNNNIGKIIFNLPKPFEIVFYDNNFDSLLKQDNIDIPDVLPKINYNLGWLLGFRDPIYTVNELNGSTYNLNGDAIVNLRGPCYFIISIDDFNNNHLNKSVICAENRREKPKIPNYSRENLNIEVRNGISTYQQIVDGDTIDNYPIKGQYPFYTRQETTKLTRPQLYSLNEITRERQKEVKFIVDSPTENNVFAIIPNTLRNNSNFGEAIILTSNQISENTRHYFGKVDIERLSIGLYDDKGNLMNLNGADWSFTLRALCSYNLNKKDDYIQYTHNLHY